MQTYSTVPGRNTQVASGPPTKAPGLINSNMPPKASKKSKAKPKRKSKGE